jgi:hypothetical protein
VAAWQARLVLLLLLLLLLLRHRPRAD